MRIVIDGRMYNESGIGRYLRNLISHLIKLDNQNEYFILHQKSDYDTLVYHSNFKKIIADFRWYGVVEQLKLPKLLNELNPDLVHFPHFNAPILYKGKYVVTIHDLIHQHFQMDRATTLGPIKYKIKQLGYKKVLRNALTKSLKIIVPSNYVKQLLKNECGIPGEKIAVTPEGVDDKILSIANKLSQQKADQVLNKYNLKKPYIFYVGNAHPHKNVVGLIKAFLKLREERKDLNLVLSGSDNYFWKKIRAENRSDGIIYAGAVTDEELIALYKNAEIFVMPSFEEGFGIPILEAMACSCPVISSDRGALKEVGGDAAIYFDPYSKEDMINKISNVLTNKDLRKSLVSRGVQRAKLFSWEKLAKETLEVYEQCV